MTDNTPFHSAPELLVAMVDFPKCEHQYEYGDDVVIRFTPNGDWVEDDDGEFKVDSQASAVCYEVRRLRQVAVKLAKAKANVPRGNMERLGGIVSVAHALDVASTVECY